MAPAIRQGTGNVDANSEAEQLSLDDLERGCAEQTALFFRREASDPRFCFELFRRAIGQRDGRAWQAVYAQYQALVRGWVQQHTAFAASGEEAGYFVNRAFERMWAALGPQFPFADLKQVLRYLQMCVHSVLLDHVRAAGHLTASAQVGLMEGLPSRSPSVEGQVMAAAQRRALWQAIDELLNDANERTVLYASFVLGLTPRELCRSEPRRFPDVREVYRIKENVLARLRRDQRLKAMFEDA